MLIYFLPGLTQLDELYNDYWRHWIAKQSQASEDILVVDIDDKSLTDLESQIGRWPWPRSTHSYLLEGLYEAPARAIIFDILFVERDLLRPHDDQFFNESVANRTNVFFASTLLENSAPVESVDISFLPASLFVDEKVIDSYGSENKGFDADKNFKIKIALPWVLSPDSWNTGLINRLTDSDGSTRKYPVYSTVNSLKLHSLPSRVVKSVEPELLKNIPAVINLKFKGTESSSYDVISYSDAKYLLERRQQLELFKNKIIIIGATAAGLHDLTVTPVSNTHPGTFILATALDNLLNSEFLKKTSLIWGLAVALLLVSFLILIITRVTEYRDQMIYSFSGLVLIAGLLYLTSLLLAKKDYLFPSVSIFSAVVGCLAVLLFYSGLREYLNKRFAEKTFSRFMDPIVVKRLVQDEGWQELVANKSSQISVLFSDIRGFTSLSEKRTAEEIMAILNNYFDSQVEAIFNHKGTLDKFIGDAIMAFWGAPIEDENHAENAINAALDMVDNLIQFRQTLPVELQTFDVGIGVNSGQAVVGMLGSARRFDYTAIGDTVNLASRIEGKTKGIARVLVSESTKALCEDRFNFEYKGQFAVKGREEEVKLYEPTRREQK
nr:adenylate/guanylate cyclase domain-containing protein [Aliikangiella sp. G2MR2-5]